MPVEPDPFGKTQEYTSERHGSPTEADSEPAPLEAEPTPEMIGRYRVLAVLGRGGFGVVYRARDDQLGRDVAIKIPHSGLVADPDAANAYLTEARTVAALDHPHVVPVYDVGCSEEHPCYIVSRYIEGVTLADKLRDQPLGWIESARLIITVAEALHAAHRQGLVHRDVKPGNILIATDGQPHLVDFGLALREENVGTGHRYAGTAAYMSPEQARGEGHRVDGRSDIFSLGVVLYQMLSGRRPFHGQSTVDVFKGITTRDPKPLRQYDETIPRELDRICRKAMSKRASERFSTAHDFAEDLQFFLADRQHAVDSRTSASITLPDERTGSESETFRVSTAWPGTDQLRVVPKGLRSFDTHDADFFLELLPGARDRDGLPEIIRFWKNRIEETDSGETFSVGVIYGPSGCGKSSLMRAGLLPRLSAGVRVAYIEAAPEETEIRLAHAVRKRCSDLPEASDLKALLAKVRQGHGLPESQKLLVVIDQFEQWLNLKKRTEDSELVQALRQCDGGRVQCIVTVRDDFWMALTRFMRELEVRMSEGENSAAVDRFPVRHAEKVLAAFGRAFGAMPENLNDATDEQRAFLRESVAGLAEDDKVICVRLALFAEMMKSKTWTPETLKQVGGTRGVGVNFLEETFSAVAAPPEHRYHEQAARMVLGALLPQSGTDIKGEMKSGDDLLFASGYCDRPADFDNLIRILDSELRLITPTDPDGLPGDSSEIERSGEQRYFQLTHDYLIHSLREWLTRKQKETRKGRAELELSDRAGVWNARPENRQLPSLARWLEIKRLTESGNWTEPQRRMMAKAGTVHAFRSVMAALLLIAVAITGFSFRREILANRRENLARLEEKENATRAEDLVDSLLKADIRKVPAVVSDLVRYREWAEPLLRERIALASDGSPEKLQLSVALLPYDQSQVDYLSRQLPAASLPQLQMLRDALLPFSDQVTEELWQWLQDENRPDPERFRIAAALATYMPSDQRWNAVAPFVARHLTTAVASVYTSQWVLMLEPARAQLTEPLSSVHANRELTDKQREVAAFALSVYLSQQPDRLVDALILSDEPAEFSPLLDALTLHSEAASDLLRATLRAKVSPALDRRNDDISTAEQKKRDEHWKRQALAAVALVNLGYGSEVWPLLEFSPDLSLRSLVIHYIGRLGVDHNELASRLEVERDVSVRRAQIQILGGLNAAMIPTADRRRIARLVQDLYVTDPDAGIHGSALWTLTQWELDPSDVAVKKPSVARESGTEEQNWYINGQGQTFVTLSPDESSGSHSFAIGSHEVTLREFRRFRPDHQKSADNEQPDAPVDFVSWYDAVAYCNWMNEQEGIPDSEWLYEPNDQGQYADGMRIKVNPLHQAGYRLPTEAEWETACRAGTTSSFYFGEPPELLPQYAVYTINSAGRTHPVGTLLPNANGIFDMHGNLWEWTHTAVNDTSNPVVRSKEDRVLIGCSFVDIEAVIRPDQSHGWSPGQGIGTLGFRLARSVAPRSDHAVK